MNYEQYGPWALVTGASRGLGAEFVRQLANKGFNIVMVARKKHLLESLATELEKKENVKTKIISSDLSETEAANVIIKATDDIQVGLLINNATMITGGALVKHDLQDEINLLNVNIVAPLKLTHHFGSKMRERGRGGIIFVASIAGYNSFPYMANYIATKSYFISLGEALYHEFKKEGVDILVLSPSFMNTDPDDTRAPYVGIENPESIAKDKMMSVTPVVNEALENLGRKITVFPGIESKIMAFIFKHILSRKKVTNILRNTALEMISKDML